MNETNMLEGFGHSLISYFRSALDQPLLFLLIPAFFLLWFASSAVGVFLLFSKKMPVGLRIQKSLFLGGVLSLFLLGLLNVILIRFTEFFHEYPLQFPMLLTAFLLGLIFLIFIYLQGQRIRWAERHGLVGEYVSEAQKLESRLKLVSEYKRMKWMLLICALPFLLILIQPRKKYLFSVVMDNSPSMAAQLQEQISSVNAAVKDPASLFAGQTDPELEKNKATFVLTHFPFSGMSKTEEKIGKNEDIGKFYDSISAIQNPAKLNTITNTFEGSVSFRSYIRGNMQPSSFGTPLIESIWQNYLYSRQEAKGQDFVKHKMIIISDGMDSFYDVSQRKIGKCIIDKFDPSFYKNDIAIINLGGAPNEYFFDDCRQFPILDGSSSESFQKAFENFFHEAFIDTTFLKMLGFIFFLTIVLGLLFRPAIF
jgi:hypothetical protein